MRLRIHHYVSAVSIRMPDANPASEAQSEHISSLSCRIVGMSGATGAIYGIRLLQVLGELEEVETHLVMSGPAQKTIALETDYTHGEVAALADHVHSNRNIAAPISSGSFLGWNGCHPMFN